MTSTLLSSTLMHMDTGPASRAGFGGQGKNHDLSVVDSTLYVPPNENEKVKKIKTIVNHLNLNNIQRATKS